MADVSQHKVYFEDLLKLTGWGLYYKFMVGILCACTFTQGAILATFILSTALYGCDFLFGKYDILTIYLSFLVGKCVCGGILCILCDRYGRKKYLCYSLIISFLISFVEAFSYNYYVFLIAAAILGAGLELNKCAAKILLSEVLTKRHRGKCLVFCDIFWIVGFLSLSAFVIFFQNVAIVADKPNELRLTNWRIMYAACGGLGLLIACSTALLEESPRYFLHIRKNYLAYLVLKQFFAINESSYAGNFEVKETEVERLIELYDLPLVEERNNYNCMGHFFIKTVVDSVSELFFNKRFVCPLLLLIIIKIPTLILGLSDLVIILEKQSRMNVTQYEKISQSGFNLVFPDTQNNVNGTIMCSLSIDEKNFYTIGSGVVLGQLICMGLIDSIGRKPLIYTGYLAACICCMSLTLVKTEIWKLVQCSILAACIGCLISSISVVNTECFPTGLRGSANSVTNFFGCLIGMFFILYIKVIFRNLDITLGIIYFCASLFSIFLPEMKKLPMIE